MLVPRAGVKLHKTNATLNQSASQQTLAAELVGRGGPQSVRVLGLLRFLSDVKNARHLHLHPKGQLIARHPCGQIVLLLRLFEVPIIELLQQVEISALMLARDADRR